MICVLVATLSACSKSGPSPPDPSNPVTGLIVSVDDGELTLRTDQEEEYISTIEDPTVPVQHLREHQRARSPVRISWQQEGHRLLATTIADA